MPAIAGGELMTQGFRWLIAAAVTLAAFCFVLCLSVALVLPTW